MVPVAVLAAWLAGTPALQSAMERFAGIAGVSLALAAMVFAFVQMNELVHELETTRLIESPRQTVEQFGRVADQLRNEPPAIWSERPTERTIAVADICGVHQARGSGSSRHLCGRSCLFRAATGCRGQRRFVSNTLTSEEDQRLVLQRMAKQSVPVVVTDLNYEHEFVHDYPLVASNRATLSRRGRRDDGR